MEINAQFQRFVDFAQTAHADGKDKRIARVNVGPELAAEGTGLYVRTIVAAKSDRVAPLWRSQTNKDANNVARELFKQAVIDIFGGLSNVPKNVMDTMLMKDYNVGKPLTARRILAVQTEVAKAAAQFNASLAAAKANCASVYDKYAIYEGHPGRSQYAVPKENLDRMVEVAIKTALKNKDALEIVAKSLPSILVRGDAKLRSLESVQAKVAEIVRNVEELRTASGGNEAYFKAGLAMLVSLDGKAAQQGIITSIIRSVNAANIGDVKKLSGSSSGVAIHKAQEQFTRLQEEILVSSGAQEAFEGGDEMAPVRSFISQLVVARCGRSSAAKIQAALNGQNAQKLSFIYGAFEAERFPKDGISKGLTAHISTMSARANSMLNTLKMCVDEFMGVEDAEGIEAFKGKFDTGEFGAGEILNDLKAAAKKQSQKAFEAAVPEYIVGNGPAADAIRDVVASKIGPEPGENPQQDVQYDANRNIRGMVNWSICRDSKRFVQGGGKDTPFAKDLARDMKVTLPGNKRLSNDYDTALDELAEFVTKGAKKTFAELDAKEKNKVYIVASLLSQETGKAAFDGQLTALDPNNFTPPIATASDQENDEREFKLGFDASGKLELEFVGTQKLVAITARKSDGKSTTQMTPAGSTLTAQMYITIPEGEFDRIAGLDFTKFDDTATLEHEVKKTGSNKLAAIPGTFAREFRLNVEEVDGDSHIKFDIKDEAVEA